MWTLRLKWLYLHFKFTLSTDKTQLSLNFLKHTIHWNFIYQGHALPLNFSRCTGLFVHACTFREGVGILFM